MPIIKNRNSSSRFSISGLLSRSKVEIPKPSDPSTSPTNSGNLTIRGAQSPVRAPSPPPLAPGDVCTYTPGHKVTPEELRELHELIRRRSELDAWIWSKRTCHPDYRGKVQREMDRSDAVLARIINMVQSWDNIYAWESKEDLKKIREVRKKVEEGGKRNWATHPPWNEE